MMSNPTAGPSGEQNGSHFDEPKIEKVSACEGSSITKLSEPLTETNWLSWRERMKRVLQLCGVEAYAEGTIDHPIGPMTENTVNWEFNDNYVQVMIINNISSTEITCWPMSNSKGHVG